MNIRIILPFLLSVATCSIHAQIGAKVQQKSGICGVWQNSQYSYQMSLILNQDGSGEFDGEALTYTLIDNKLNVLSGNETTTYKYILQGNSLLLSGGDLNEQMTFTRQGSQPTSTSTDIVVQEDSAPLNNSSPAVSPANDIVGIWSGNGETLEFKSNGECAYLGQVFPYHLASGSVRLTTSQGDISFQYTIIGDQLSLTGNNSTVTYSRGNGSTGNSQQQSTGTGQVALELVGKWCFTNVNSYNQGASSSSECVTLNADGTYLYYSESSRSVNTSEYAGGTASQNEDRGTWYVQGDRLYVHSQTVGNTSYKLEKRNHPKNVNDPMIVLDGRTFVTAYNKPPWR